MTVKTPPERVIELMLISVKSSFCIPPSVTASKWQVMCFKLLQILAFINQWILTVALSVAIYHNLDNPNIMVSCVCIGCITSSGLVEIVVCTVYSKRVQYIISELQNYCKRPETHVKEILQSYVDKYLRVYVCFTLLMYFNAAMFALGPTFLPQPLPTHAQYPLPLENGVVRCIIYAHQVMTAIQCAAQICLNGFCAMTLWFVAAEFEVLNVEFRIANDAVGFRKCVVEHQRLLRFAKEVTGVVRFLMLSELVFGTVRLVFSALTFMTPQPIVERAQFMIVNITALISSFVSIWPADTVMHANSNIGCSAYQSNWYDRSTKDIRRNLIIVLLRCRKAVSVSIGCILPAASLAYYRAYVAAAASYFTVLHAVINNEPRD